MKGIITSSQDIILRKTSMDDLNYVIQTEQDPESKNFILLWSREQHVEALNNKDFSHLIIEDNERNQLGYVIILGTLNPNSCFEILRINLSVRDKGYGKKAMNLIMGYLFNNLKAHRVWLDVRERNQRAIHLYKSLGFKVEGVLRECIKTDDKYESLMLMGILKTEYTLKEGELR